MEITFLKVKKIKIAAVKPSIGAGASWIQINVCDQEGEHIINCFPENDEAIPISWYPVDDDDG